MFKEKNTGSNLPAQIDLYATDGDEYHFQVGSHVKPRSSCTHSDLA